MFSESENYSMYKTGAIRCIFMWLLWNHIFDQYSRPLISSGIFLHDCLHAVDPGVYFLPFSMVYCSNNYHYIGIVKIYCLEIQLTMIYLQITSKQSISYTLCAVTNMYLT